MGIALDPASVNSMIKTLELRTNSLSQKNKFIYFAFLIYIFCKTTNHPNFFGGSSPILFHAENAKFAEH